MSTVGAPRRYQVRMDDETYTALRRLASAEERSMAAQLRLLVRQEAQKRGLWTYVRPAAVSAASK